MSEPVRPTQQTIADRAGVTKATVSLALRNSPLLPERTKERIREIATELGYRPNPMVNSLMAYVRTHRPPSFHASIAFITNFREREEWMRSKLFADWYHGAKERGSALGYLVDHFWLAEPGMDARKASKILWNRGVMGVIFAPMASPHQQIDLDFSKFGVVAIGYTLRQAGIACVTSNHVRNMEVIMRNLKEFGYSHVGLAVSRTEHERTDYAWLTGVHTAHYKGCGPKKLSIFGMRQWGEKKFEEWLRRSRPEVVLAASREVLCWLHRLGVPIPEKLGFVSLEAMAEEKFSGLDQNFRLAGMTAADMVIAQIDRNECGIHPHAQMVMIDGDWVEGTTIRQV